MTGTLDRQSLDPHDRDLAALFFATSILLVTLSNYARAPHSLVG